MTKKSRNYQELNAEEIQRVVDNMPPGLRQEDLGCKDPACTDPMCGRVGVGFSAQCHPDAGLWIDYWPPNGVLVVGCSACNEWIAVIAVAEGTKTDGYN